MNHIDKTLFVPRDSGNRCSWTTQNDQSTTFALATASRILASPQRSQQCRMDPKAAHHQNLWKLMISKILLFSVHHLWSSKLRPGLAVAIQRWRRSWSELLHYFKNGFTKNVLHSYNSFLMHLMNCLFPRRSELWNWWLVLANWWRVFADHFYQNWSWAIEKLWFWCL